MEFLIDNLPWIQMTLAILVVVLVVLQQGGTGLGGAFGGSDGGAVNHTRRGVEKTLLHATTVVGVLFALSVLISLFI